MRLLGSWLVRAGVGLVRSCIVLLVSLAVPAVWAAAAAWGIWWGAANPWSWFGPLVLVCVGTVGLSRPVCHVVRSLVATWTGTVISAGYRLAPPVRQMSTGYWWNGFSYERTRRDALLDQRMRVRWRDPAIWCDLRFVALAPLTLGLVAGLPVVGVAAGFLGLSQPGTPGRVVGLFGLVVGIASSPRAWRYVEPVAVRLLRPSPAMALADRVDELTIQRADVTVAQAAEIRRIERDLHDGAQARLVALGLGLATAEKLMDTDPVRAKALMREARAGATESLTELRELVRGISPPVLNDRGLVDAVRALALDSAVETTVTTADQFRLDPPIESALYFAVAELLTNAVKHAGATQATIAITRGDPGVVIDVEDDGCGGAGIRAGGGLEGLRRRLAVFDGSLEITSPVGGPTRVTLVVPCESS